MTTPDIAKIMNPAIYEIEINPFATHQCARLRTHMPHPILCNITDYPVIFSVHFLRFLKKSVTSEEQSSASTPASTAVLG